MRKQTKRSILPGKKIGKRVPCGLCERTGCERCSGRGTVLYPLQQYVERLVA